MKQALLFLAIIGLFLVPAVSLAQCPLSGGDANIRYNESSTGAWGIHHMGRWDVDLDESLIPFNPGGEWHFHSALIVSADCACGGEHNTADWATEAGGKMYIDVPAARAADCFKIEIEIWVTWADDSTPTNYTHTWYTQEIDISSCAPLVTTTTGWHDRSLHRMLLVM